jgi:hypothetical protein
MDDNAPAKPLMTPKLLLEILCLLLIMVVGWYDRVDQMSNWFSQPETTFHEKDPLLQGLDGYHYLNLSREYSQGTYDANIAKNREDTQPIATHPDHVPLLSVLIAKVSEATSYSLLWAAVLIPAFLGPLLAIPLYLLGRFFGGAIMGLTAAVVGIYSPYYVQRTGFGWCDTDVFNVTFLFGLSYCFLRFSHSKPGRGNGWLAAALSIFFLFIWWWNSAVAQITAIFLALVFLTMVYPRNIGKTRKLVLAATAVAALSVVSIWLGFDYLAQIPYSIAKQLLFFSKASSTSTFPNIAQSISETANPSMAKIVNMTSGGMMFFTISALGTLLLLRLRLRDGALIMIPALMISVWGMFTVRFLIFSGPFLALGLGFLLSTIWQRWGKERYRLVGPVIILTILLALFFRFNQVSTMNFQHKILQAETAGAMAQAKDIVPKDGVIWVWWDAEHPLQYWSERKVIGFTNQNTGEHVVYLSLPVIAADQRLAANFMRFYLKRGQVGMQTLYKSTSGDIHKGMELAKKIAAAGPKKALEILKSTKLTPQHGLESVDDWMEFFFPANSPPIYLFLRLRSIKIIRWWYKYGKWDVRRNNGPNSIFVHLDHLKKRENGDLVAPNGRLQVSADGKLYNASAKLMQKIMEKPEKLKDLNFEAPPSLTVMERKAKEQFFFMNKSIADSTIIQLFIRNRPQAGYFKLAATYDEDHQLWEVLPDAVD